MRLFLDANVLLDVLLARQPFVNDSERVLSLCAKKVFDGCCSGLTICNLMYILRKHCPMDVARRCMRDFSTYVEIVDVKSNLQPSRVPCSHPILTLKMLCRHVAPVNAVWMRLLHVIKKDL